MKDPGYTQRHRTQIIRLPGDMLFMGPQLEKSHMITTYSAETQQISVA